MELKGIGLVAVVGLIAFTAVGCSNSTDTSNMNGQTMTVHYSPSCSCCKRYVSYLREQGLNVTAKQSQTRELLHAEHGVPRDARSCHTGVIEDYVVEGHVPVETIARLLRQQPNITGVSIPGMPRHAPGMGRPNGSTLDIISINQTGNIEGTFNKQTY